MKLPSELAPVGGSTERSQSKKAVLVIVVVWLAFVLPFFRGQVRFPVDFAGPTAGHAVVRVANPEQGDAYYAMFPWHHYLGERLRHGDIPLWDPHRFAGTPFAADIAMGVWYPPNWLYALGHTLHVFTLISVASSLAALLLMYWFLRVIRLHPYAAAFGAVAFAFSAFVVKWATNDTVLGSIVWLALPLGGLELARQGHRWRGTVLTAVGLALVALGGHAQLATYVWTITAGWAGIGLAATGSRLLRRRSSALPDVAWTLAREAVPIVGAVALAIGLAAIQLLPTQQLVKEIVRQRTTFEVARGTFLPRVHAATALLPNYLGSPVDGNYGGPGVNYTETMLYAGLLTIPLALHGLRHRHRRASLFFATLVVVGCLSIFGTPFYRLVLATPGLSRGLFATRFILLVDFGLAGLAALGFDRLLRRETEHHRRLALLTGSFVAMAGAVGWLTLGRPGTSLSAAYIRPIGLQAIAVLALGAITIAAMVKIPSWAGRLAVILIFTSAADLWATGYRFNPFHVARPIYLVQPPIGELQAIPGTRPRFVDVGDAASVPPNAALVYDLYGLSGYDPLIPKPIVELVGVAEDQTAQAHGNFFGPFHPKTATAPVFDLLGIDGVVGRLDQLPFPNAEGFPVFRRPGAFPPAFVASCWDLLPATQVLTRVGEMSSADLRSTVVVGSAPAARRVLTKSVDADCSSGDAEVERYQAERVTMSVHTSKPSILVLTDSWSPGWKASVDGKSAPVLRVDHALRGVAVGPGAHRVDMHFQPASFRFGAAISMTTIVTLLGISGKRGFRRRRRRRRPAESGGVR